MENKIKGAVESVERERRYNRPGKRRWWDRECDEMKMKVGKSLKKWKKGEEEAKER